DYYCMVWHNNVLF
nr:immunoglobulin light chain junction region [Macaca mulatta]